MSRVLVGAETAAPPRADFMQRPGLQRHTGATADTPPEFAGYRRKSPRTAISILPSGSATRLR
jgi:hypothetical protein